jgi:membrane-associated phospholipid phosphatase
MRLPLRPQETRVVVAAVCVLAFATADVLTGGPLVHLDAQIRAAVHPGLHGVPAWLDTVGALGDIGPAAALVAIAGLTCAQALWRLWPVALAVGNLATAEVAVLIVKAAVSRSGPATDADQSGYPGYFPSGHTTTAAVASGTVVFLVMAGWSRGARLHDAGWAGLGCGLAVGSLTAIGAVLGNFHWASDGLGGLALATIVLVAGFASVRPFVPSRVAAGARARD